MSYLHSNAILLFITNSRNPDWSNIVSTFSVYDVSSVMHADNTGGKEPLSYFMPLTAQFSQTYNYVANYKWIVENI